MKMKLRLLPLLIALLLILSFTGCNKAETEQTSATKNVEATKEAEKEAEAEATQEEKEIIELTAFAVEGPYTTGDFNDLAIWPIVEKATGIKVNFDAVPPDAKGERLTLLFATGGEDLPDMLFKCGLSSIQITTYADEGFLAPISDYMDEYAPNLSYQLGENPHIEKCIIKEDGNIYGFPYMVTGDSSKVGVKMLVNNIWMTENGYEMPKTTDDLYELLKLFAQSDFNGNGENDEIPLAVAYDWRLDDALMGSFGLLNKGSTHRNFDYDENTQSVRYFKTSDAYKQYLQYLNKLYSEKLLDQEYFTSDIPSFTAKAVQNIVGFAFIGNNSYLDVYKDDFITLPDALTGPNGDQIFSSSSLGYAGECGFVLADSEYVEEAISYIDYFYSEDGICTYFMGVEGETYEYGDDGKPYFTEFVTDNPDGLSMEEALGSYVAWSGGGNPTIADDDHFAVHLRSKITVDAALAMIPYLPDEIWAEFTFSVEDSERLSMLSADIDSYAAEMQSKFVRGDVSFDEWDTYIENIKNMGLDEYIEIYQKGYESYVSK